MQRKRHWEDADCWEFCSQSVNSLEYERDCARQRKMRNKFRAPQQKADETTGRSVYQAGDDAMVFHPIRAWHEGKVKEHTTSGGYVVSSGEGENKMTIHIQTRRDIRPGYETQVLSLGRTCSEYHHKTSSRTVVIHILQYVTAV